MKKKLVKKILKSGRISNIKISGKSGIIFDEYTAFDKSILEKNVVILGGPSSNFTPNFTQRNYLRKIFHNQRELENLKYNN